MLRSKFNADVITKYGQQTTTFQLADEVSYSIIVDNVVRYHVVCSDVNIKEMAIGRLVSDGLIRTCDEIVDVRIDNQSIYITLHPIMHQESPHSTTTKKELTPLALQTINHALQHSLPLYTITQNTHSCFLINNNKLLCGMEDVSRYNAVDKVLGWAILQNAPLHDCVIFSTGRPSAEMIRKVAQIGIPILASKAFPTSTAVHAATKYNISLFTIRDIHTIIRFNE